MKRLLLKNLLQRWDVSIVLLILGEHRKGLVARQMRTPTFVQGAVVVNREAACPWFQISVVQNSLACNLVSSHGRCCESSHLNFEIIFTNASC